MYKVKRAISMLLIITIITTLIPSLANATEKIVEAKPNVTQFPVEDSSIAPKIIGELTEKREANVKHFLKDDLSYEAVVYREPVHFHEGGDWKEVDN